MLFQVALSDEVMTYSCQLTNRGCEGVKVRHWDQILLVETKSHYVFK